MKHFPFLLTPINKLPYFSKKLGVNLVCKRDDLFQDACGGSKARMLQYILEDVNPQNYDVLVTAGGPCSNFNRACALMCAKLGVRMHLIEYTDEPKEWESLNYYLCKLAGIKTTRCDKNEVSETIKHVVESYVSQGKTVKNVYGGGKSVEGVFAYYDAVRELSRQISHIDHVFVACGTGTTFTGICAGMQKFFPSATVHAVSTARTYDKESPVLFEDMSMLNDYLGTSYDFSNMVFSDNYLCGGYAKYDENIMDAIKECISHEGMILDPTYSGKAFYGMVDKIQKNKSEYASKTILFWNTGGIMNLLSTQNDYKTSK